MPATNNNTAKITALFLLIGAITLGVFVASWLARKSNAERDAGITWVWAYSPRTMQTYLVRAVVDDEDGTVIFHLEDKKTEYRLYNCHPPEGEDTDSCRDQNEQLWDVNQ